MDILERVVFWLKDYELRIVYFLNWHDFWNNFNDQMKFIL